VCLFTGVVDLQREEPSMRVTMVEPVHEVLARRVDRVVLTVEDASDGLLERVRAVLGDHPGEVPVYLRFKGEGEDRIVRCGARFKVKVSEEALDAFSTLLGRENVLCR